jgi:hypothetical protein
MRLTRTQSALGVIALVGLLALIAWTWPSRAKVLRHAKNPDAHAGWHEAYSVRQAFAHWTRRDAPAQLCALT